MKIAVCEDESIHAERLVKLILDFSERIDVAPVLSVFCNGVDLISDIDSMFDVIFLDICMNGENGLDIAQQIREKDKSVILIFVTSHIDFVQAGYEVRAFRYILKNQLEIQLLKILSDVKKEIEADIFQIVVNYETILISKKDIYYFEANKRQIICFSKNAQHSFYGKMDILSKSFTNFVRCHKSFLVSSEYIKSFNSKEVVLINGTIIPVSRTFKQALLLWFGR